MIEQAKFQKQVKALQRRIRKFAASTAGDNGAESKGILRALDRLSQQRRFAAAEMVGADWTIERERDASESLWAVTAGLHAAWRFANRETQANIRAERYIEMARLDAEIRAKRRPNPDTAWNCGSWL